MSTSTIPQIVPLPNKRIKDITGHVFGRLTVLGYAGKNRYSKNIWLCACSCGNYAVTPYSHLSAGRTRSCGCLNIETRESLGRNIKHGMRNTSEYSIWRGMFKRCYNPSHMGFRNYGGRGIVVCDRWREFKNFFEDMGKRPSPKHTLDRIDNNKGYYPENCHWATREQQARNKRNCTVIHWHNESHSITEWASILNKPRNALWLRIYQYGWDTEKAFTTPIGYSRVSKK